MPGSSKGAWDLRQESKKQVSQIMSAVKVQNAWKSYDSKNPVICNLNMTVPRGTIYGLLGASGCGKTTILSCIVGTRKLDSGSVSVFGHVPGTPESGIPGPAVGFMPQELALYDTLTIGETFEYFGQLYGMNDSELTSKMASMLTVLDLPGKSMLVGSLSGGQRRRTSLGVSLIHEPPLLILDEPTVGVDPLLRERIWDYLYELVASKGTTVIITTHYIEESKNAHTVGVMRNGRLIEEASPTFLLQQHGTNRLEDVVLKLFKIKPLFEIPLNDSSPQPTIHFKTCQEPDELLKSNNLRKVRDLAKSLGRLFFNPLSQKRQAKVEIAKGVSNTVQEPAVCLRFQNISESFPGHLHPDPDPDVEGSRSPKSSLPFIDADSSVHFMMGKRPGNKLKRVMAISYKNLRTVVRHKIILILLLIIPPINLYTGIVSLGGEPQGLTFGVVNPETNYTLDVCRTLPLISLETLSCRLLNQLSANTLTLLPKLSYDAALADVFAGRSLGFMEFPQNYSHHSVARVAEGVFASNETLVGSTISIRMDKSNAVSSLLVQRSLFQGFQRYARAALAQNGEDPAKAELPLKFSAVYGTVDDSNSGTGKYLAAAFLILLSFYLPTLPTACGCTSDHKNGTFERARIAGATAGELILGALIVNFCIVVFVSGYAYILLIYGMQMDILGSTYLCFTLCVLTGICGGFAGIALSEIFTHELQVLFIGACCFMQSVGVCGILWPIETLPQWLSFICNSTPYTWTIRSLRYGFTRGWGIRHPKVWPGVAILLIWIGILSIIILIARRRKH